MQSWCSSVGLYGAGTGKSTYINRHLVQGLPKESWAPLFITFSARTTANMAQEQVCTCPHTLHTATAHVHAQGHVSVAACVE